MTDPWRPADDDTEAWRNSARMAAARLAAYGWPGLSERDAEALRRHPDLIPPDADPAPARLPAPVPQFDGATYREHRDYARLGAQARRVWDAMSDGHWHTLADLRTLTGDPEASISARLRDFRKEQWGGHEVEHRNLGGGTWEYRLTVLAPASQRPTIRP